MGDPEPLEREREFMSGMGGGVRNGGLEVRDDGGDNFNEGGAGRAHDGEEIWDDNEDVSKGDRCGRLGRSGSGAAKRSAMDGTGVLQEGGLCVVEGERSRVGGEAGEGDVLDPVARQRVTDGAGRVEGSGVARGEGYGDENREERGVVEHVPESVGVGEGVGGGRDAVIFEGVTVCGGKPVGLSWGVGVGVGCGHGFGVGVGVGGVSRVRCREEGWESRVKMGIFNARSVIK